jgi:hypothetical protein
MLAAAVRRPVRVDRRRWRPATRLRATVDVLQSILNALAGTLDFLRTQTPGGFGLLAVPLGVLAIISLLAARRR